MWMKTSHAPSKAVRHISTWPTSADSVVLEAHESRKNPVRISAARGCLRMVNGSGGGGALSGSGSGGGEADPASASSRASTAASSTPCVIAAFVSSEAAPVCTATARSGDGACVRLHDVLCDAQRSDQ